MRSDEARSSSDQIRHHLAEPFHRRVCGYYTPDRGWYYTSTNKVPFQETCEAEVLILGGGLAGLSAASGTQNCILLDANSAPGGLVRTDHFNGYWFDHVLHLLYFPDSATEAFIRSLLGDQLWPCIPVAWVHTTEGATLYPLQMHLGALPQATVVRCLRDLAEATYTPAARPPESFEETLLSTFGRRLCEVFLFPYNRKVWKRPLCELAPAGFQWTITPPHFEQVLRGALDPNASFEAYNAHGWYPRPSSGSPRGMAVLSAALAGMAPDLQLGHTVTGIDLKQHLVTARHGSREVRFRFERSLCSTLPLPHFIRLCTTVPEELRRAAERLKYNRVVSVMFLVRGPRPKECGHWTYYSDESLAFNRLIYMHAFDPEMAPAEGWGLLAEITDTPEAPLASGTEWLKRCRGDISRAGILPSGCEIVGERVRIVDPAYVVFTKETQAITARVHTFLRENGVEPLGRYGRWEYASMGQVIRDGREWAERVAPHAKTVTP